MPKAIARLIADTLFEGDLLSTLIRGIMTYSLICPLNTAVEGEYGQPIADHPPCKNAER
jgi:hypothetical protein